MELVQTEFDSIISSVGWGKLNQIGLKARPNAENKWVDAAGSLYDRQLGISTASETDFSEWNLDSNSYIRQQIEMIERSHNFKSGRVRFMRLPPRNGLSVHRDDEVRFHLVLSTNIKSYIAHSVVIDNPTLSVLPTTAVCYHLPMDSNWYEVDTREIHWVYNGGDTERIHLVVCASQ